ncbi:MAG TPA: hypothetical protein DET40_05995 [Lentisphaeria bacterium]|nr:MAG: hypothetical protein A2X45_04500 [Lentisphaerae bacterium GWF2_50_93]HCE43079.1 hypothetical protein [Lentisphaeria bacterium]
MNRISLHLDEIVCLMAGLLGIIAGLIYFLARRSPSAENCRDLGRLRREFLFSAVIVSSLFSYIFFCSTKLLAQDKTELTQSDKKGVVNDKRKILESKEWQELKVYWNVITAKYDTLQEDDRYSGGYSDWKNTLLEKISEYKISKLDRLVSEGTMSKDTQKALDRIVKGIASYMYNSNSGGTCYMMTQEGARRKENLGKLYRESLILQQQFDKGTLTPEVLKKATINMTKILEALELLDEKSEQREDAGEELVITDKVESKSRAFIDYIVDLNEYTEEPDAEKTLYNEFKGKNAVDIILNLLKDLEKQKKKGIEGMWEARRIKRTVADALGAIGGKEQNPILRDLYKDEALSTFQRSSSTSDGKIDDDKMELFVHYPIRDAAARALQKRGVQVKLESEQKPDSSDGRAMILKAFESDDLLNNQYGINAAGFSKDKSMIPVIAKFAEKSPFLADDVIEALGSLGGKASVQMIISIYEKNDRKSTSSLADALGKIGGGDAVAYLKKEYADDKNKSAKSSFLKALIKVNAAGLDRILDSAIKDSDKNIQIIATIKLYKSGNQGAENIIKGILDGNDKSIVSSLRIHLWNDNDPKAKELMDKCNRSLRKAEGVNDVKD